MNVIIMTTNKTEWTINQTEISNYFYLKEDSQKFYSPAGYRDWETGGGYKERS